MLAESVGNLVDGALVVVLQAATQGVGERFLAETADELVPFAGRKDMAQLGGASERFAARQLATRVYRVGTVLFPPAANSVEVLQPEADRIHAGVARGAER